VPEEVRDRYTQCRRWSKEYKSVLFKSCEQEEAIEEQYYGMGWEQWTQAARILECGAAEDQCGNYVSCSLYFKENQEND
jgi:hypothetical protein